MQKKTAIEFLPGDSQTLFNTEKSSNDTGRTWSLLPVRSTIRFVMFVAAMWQLKLSPVIAKDSNKYGWNTLIKKL